MTQRHAGLHLSSGSRVAVVGGGPAGSLVALHLLRFASRMAIPLSVTIFERKDFGRRGPAGCNKCAGILSARVMQGLSQQRGGEGSRRHNDGRHQGGDLCGLPRHHE